MRAACPTLGPEALSGGRRALAHGNICSLMKAAQCRVSLLIGGALSSDPQQREESCRSGSLIVGVAQRWDTDSFACFLALSLTT